MASSIFSITVSTALIIFSPDVIVVAPAPPKGVVDPAPTAGVVVMVVLRVFDVVEVRVEVVVVEELVVQFVFFLSLQIMISSSDLSSVNAAFSRVLQTPMFIARISISIAKVSFSCFSVMLSGSIPESTTRKSPSLI